MQCNQGSSGVWGFRGNRKRGRPRTGAVQQVVQGHNIWPQESRLSSHTLTRQRYTVANFVSSSTEGTEGEEKFTVHSKLTQLVKLPDTVADLGSVGALITSATSRSNLLDTTMHFVALVQR